MTKEEYHKHYEERVLKIIYNVGQWVIYNEDTKHPLVVDWKKSLSKLEELIKEIR